MSKTLVKNCRIITPYQVLDDSCIEIDGMVISGIISAAAAGAKDYDRVLDCNGDYVAPGFIDIHNHGNSGYDVMDATAEALENISRFHLTRGVTGFLGATMSQATGEIQAALENIIAWAGHRRPGDTPRSRLLGVYLEGPYFSKRRKGAQAEEHIKDPDLAELKGFLETAGEYLKVVALAPELPGAIETIKYLKSRGIVVAAGHTDANYAQVEQAVAAGVTSTVHLFNGMQDLLHREPGPAGVMLLDERVSCELICDGIHLHPAIIDLTVRLKGADGVILISDAMRATGLGDGRYDLGGQEVIVAGGIARLPDGTLAGSTLTLDRAVRNVIQMAKIPVHQAVQMATLNPAQLIGVADRKGSIEPGKDADLVIFDEDIKVKKVLIDGQIVSFE